VASAEVDVVHPGLRITASSASSDGTSMKLAYRITNTGDSVIRRIRLTDGSLGVAGFVDALQPGRTATIVRRVEVSAGAVKIRASATGVDVTGRAVTTSLTRSIGAGTSDDAGFPDTPFTGLEANDAAALSLLLLLVGILALLAPRRRADG
jgi:hypothetical protein